MTNGAALPDPKLDPAKFRDPDVTADGAPRASVPFAAYRTLWFNTGSLCNLTCRNCYIESSPTNDRLAYISGPEVVAYLDELDGAGAAEPGLREIGFTGGEPFMNPEIMAMIEAALARDHRVLVLTNAMRPMRRHEKTLLALKDQYGPRLVIRVSLDHYTQALHDLERGAGSWKAALAGLVWLSRNGFATSVAGRNCWGETIAQARVGYARLFLENAVSVDTADHKSLILFPEMDETLDVPEIAEACWAALDIKPGDVMCASSRMVVKRKGAQHPVVVPCTLLPYDQAFEMGRTLAEAAHAVKLNHPHCSRFCVLGGGSCSRNGS